MRILVVDDDRATRRQLARIAGELPDADVVETSSLEEAREQIGRRSFDVALIDLRLSPNDPDNRDGLTLVREVRERAIVPIVVSGSDGMRDVREAMRFRAHDYILKEELCPELVLPILHSLRDRRALEREVIALRSKAAPAAATGLVGTSKPMQVLREMIQRVAVSDRPVLVRGGSGTGKEVVVRALHAMGRHPQAALLDLNCAGFPEALMESQLFGHERGAFTGADRKHDGYFTAVGGGTLFLDEIAELPLQLQAKLLRVLEAGTFRPVGSNTPRTFDGRVVAATHVDLEARVREGRFREDLFFRLNVLEIWVPSLEDRRDDIPALVSHFAAAQARALTFTADAMADLQRARWPGNLRQLRNLVDRLAVLAPDGPITSETIARVAGGPQQDGGPVVELVRQILRGSEGDKFSVIERVLIDEALRMAEGNKTAAARLLGVHRKVVERRVERIERIDDAEPASA
jgi:DNA-binding NtrC family response regulator